MSQETPVDGSPALIKSLHKTLHDLSQDPYPHIENPPSCKKRASVALIIRIRPHFNHSPPVDLPPSDSSLDPAAQLESFFAQSWVQHGSPEAIFIKRAARIGDRWTSHVALPGGKSDPEDADDRATAIRETSEEIGLDLTQPGVVSVGNLPERIISTTSGKVPIMVLCPFLFVYTTPDVPTVNLQPTEVASTHWVPLRVLLSPSVRTHEYVDVSDRFARTGGVFLKLVVKSLLGRMRFSAIRLIPSESVYCSTSAEFFPLPVPGPEPQTTQVEKFYKWYLGDHAGSADRERPLLLWGLTLGILADFLDQLPPHNAVKLWSYPTFTSWDSQFIIHMMTLGLKKRNKARLERDNQTAVDRDTEAVAPSGDNPWFIGGMSEGMMCRGKNASQSYAVGVMIEGYYDMARRGAWVAFFGRLMGSAALMWYIIRRYRRQG